MTDEELEMALIRSIVWGAPPGLFDSRVFALAMMDAERRHIPFWWYMLKPLVWLALGSTPFVSYLLWILWLEGKL